MLPACEMLMGERSAEWRTSECPPIRTRPGGLVLRGVGVLVGLVGCAHSVQPPPSRFFLVVALVWTALMTLALAGKVRFILHITLTGLRWREFREHELP